MREETGRKTRLFVAVAVPETARDQIVSLARDTLGFRRTAALHLTLRCIGEIEADRARSIKTVLRDVRADNFLLTVRGFGMFARKQGTVVWAGVAPSPALLHLKEAVDAALAGAGLPPSTGRFTPHLTLARLKTGPSSALCAFLKGHAATPAGTFPVTAFSLFRSVLDPGGAVHTLEEDYPLMG